MIYVDTSSLLKLFLTDAHSPQVDLAISEERVVAVSSLTELEACIQIKALSLGGKISHAKARRIREGLSLTLIKSPFLRRRLTGSIFKAAMAQHEAATVHCRSLDRLHLAAMEELGIKRLMTHDARQAAVALEMGYQIISPGL